MTTKSKTIYDQYCELKCLQTGQQTEANIYRFHPEENLHVCVRTRPPLDLVLVYDKDTQLYVGRQAGLDFTTRGPKSYQVNENIRLM